MPIPVAILGGSDRRPAYLPESGAVLHPLAAYKGAAVTLGGRPLVACLVERLLAAGGFGPVAVIGPERVYAPLDLPAEVIDSDGSVAANLRAAIERHAGCQGPMAVMACDVLPSVDELADLRRRFEATPCRLWLPLVQGPEDPERLGASAWKPTYALIPRSGSEPVRILPGHLCIFEPDALRLPLFYRLLDAAYRSRNRPLAHRYPVLLGAALSELIAGDLRLLAGLHLPTRTVATVYSGLRLVLGLRAARLDVEGLERIVARIVLRRRHGKLPRDEQVRLPILDVLSLAADIDTEEEARELVDRAARDGTSH